MNFPISNTMVKYVLYILLETIICKSTLKTSFKGTEKHLSKVLKNKKTVRIYQVKTKRGFQQMVLGKLNIYMQRKKNEGGHLPYTIYKN